MKRAAPVHFAVVTPGGAPAAGALVYLATPTILLNVPGGIPFYGDAKPIAVTNADGRFNILPPDEPYRLAISHKTGSAEINGGQTDQTVTLTPWASIDLAANWDGKPLAGADVQPQSGYSEDLHCPIDWGGDYKSDGLGKVSITGWRAGPLLMSTFIKNANEFESLEVQRTLKPGEHADLRLLTGRTTLRASLMQPAGFEWVGLTLSPCGSAAILPADINQLPLNKRRAAANHATDSAPDKNAQEQVLTRMRASPRDDGTLEITGLSPGTYSIQSWSQPLKKSSDSATHPKQISNPPSLEWYFSIPSTQPPVLDLGSISADTPDRSAVSIGSPVPELAIPALDGKPFSLSKLQGKWVLLDFWATWCGICIREEPTLKDAYEGWGADGRLTMVSVSVDDTVEQVKKHIADANIPWTQLVLGPRDKTNIPELFGVQGYPTTLLISPDGKLIDKNLRGQRLRDVLIEHIGAPSPPR